MMKRIFRGHSVLIAAALLAVPGAAFAQSSSEACSRDRLDTITEGLIRSVNAVPVPRQTRAMLRDPITGPLFGESDAAHFNSAGTRLVHWTNQYIRYARREGDTANARSVSRYLNRAFDAMPRTVQAQYRCFMQAQADGGYDGAVLERALASLNSSGVALAGAPRGRGYGSEIESLHAVTRVSRVPPLIESGDGFVRDRTILQGLGIRGLVLEVAGPTSASDADAAISTVSESDSPAVHYRPRSR